MQITLLIIIPVLIIAISIIWTNLVGAPWLPSSMKVVNKMLKMAEVGPGDMVYDLGRGDGRMIITAARHFGARGVGIEIDPLRYIWCRILLSILRLHGRVRVVYGDFFTQDLGEADVVTCYLLQSTNNKLESKLKEELKPGARVVSNSFTFPGMHLIRYDQGSNLYLYELGL